MNLNNLKKNLDILDKIKENINFELIPKEQNIISETPKIKNTDININLEPNINIERVINVLSLLNIRDILFNISMRNNVFIASNVLTFIKKYGKKIYLEIDILDQRIKSWFYNNIKFIVIKNNSIYKVCNVFDIDVENIYLGRTNDITGINVLFYDKYQNLVFNKYCSLLFDLNDNFITYEVNNSEFVSRGNNLFFVLKDKSIDGFEVYSKNYNIFDLIIMNDPSAKKILDSTAKIHENKLVVASDEYNIGIPAGTQYMVLFFRYKIGNEFTIFSNTSVFDVGGVV